MGGAIFLTLITLGPTTRGMLFGVLGLIGVIEALKLKAPFYAIFVAGGFAAAHFHPDVLIIVFATWITDIGAYLFGRKFGKRKLAPTISPNKTWEGAIGGFLLAVILGAALGRPTIGMVAGTFGQAGDLLESKIKRREGVKDSGTLLPGHGGVLDRFDAFVVNAAICWAINLAR